MAMALDLDHTSLYSCQSWRVTMTEFWSGLWKEKCLSVYWIWNRNIYQLSELGTWILTVLPSNAHLPTLTWILQADVQTLLLSPFWMIRDMSMMMKCTSNVSWILLKVVCLSKSISVFTSLRRKNCTFCTLWIPNASLTLFCSWFPWQHVKFGLSYFSPSVRFMHNSLCMCMCQWYAVPTFPVTLISAGHLPGKTHPVHWRNTYIALWNLQYWLKAWSFVSFLNWGVRFVMIIIFSEDLTGI